MRYGSRQNEIMNAIAKVVKALSNDYKIKYYVFHEGDFQALKYFENNNTDMEIINLNTGLTTAEIIKACTSLNLVIGMRGHAQLIPFGCNIPILSVISHDKLKWFLDDINHPEWGVDVLDKDFEHKLYDTARYILNNQQKIREQINTSQQNLYEITNENLKFMLEKYAVDNCQQRYIG